MNYSEYIKRTEEVKEFYQARQNQPASDLETIAARLRDIEDFLSRNSEYKEFLYRKYFEK